MLPISTTRNRAFWRRRKPAKSQAFCADAGYRGTFIAEVQQQLQRRVDISEKIKPHEWEKLPWRWIVERTFG